MSENKSPLKVLAEQRRLLQLEYDAEKRAYSEITEKIGVHPRMTIILNSVVRWHL